MALKKTITLKNNFGQDSVFTDAYIKVELYSVTASNASAKILIFSDSDKNNLLETVSTKFMPDLESNDNFLVQGYTKAKSIAQFSGASDI